MDNECSISSYYLISLLPVPRLVRFNLIYSCDSVLLECFVKLLVEPLTAVHFLFAGVLFGNRLYWGGGVKTQEWGFQHFRGVLIDGCCRGAEQRAEDAGSRPSHDWGEERSTGSHSCPGSACEAPKYWGQRWWWWDWLVGFHPGGGGGFEAVKKMASRLWSRVDEGGFIACFL